MKKKNIARGRQNTTQERKMMKSTIAIQDKMLQLMLPCWRIHSLAMNVFKCVTPFSRSMET